MAPLRDEGAIDEEPPADEEVDAVPVVNDAVLLDVEERWALLIVLLRAIEVPVPALAALPTAVALARDAELVTGAVVLELEDLCDPPTRAAWVDLTVEDESVADFVEADTGEDALELEAEPPVRVIKPV